MKKLLFVLFLVPVSVLAQDDSTAFPKLPFQAQGMKLGDRPSKAYMAANGLDAADMQKPEVYARHAIQVPGGEVSQLLGFQHGYLSKMSLTFDPDTFDEVVKIFSQRLGSRPHALRDEPVSNNYGAIYQNKVALWSTDCGLLRITKYGSKLDKGFGFIVLPSLIEADKAGRKQSRAAAAGKF